MDELCFLSERAGFWKPAEEGDWFWARNAVEYNEPSPNADLRYGAVRRGHWMQAQQVVVVMIPSADCFVKGIAIKVESTRVPGAIAWVNVFSALLTCIALRDAVTFPIELLAQLIRQSAPY